MTDPAAPQPQPQYQAPQPAAPLTEAEDKQWASFAHFGGVLGFLPALIIFLVFKDRGAKTRVEAKEALNWQITWTAAYIILWILWAIVSAIAVSIAFATLSDGPLILAGLFYWLPGILWVLNVVFSIIGGVKVNGGGSYRYPVAVRLIK